MSLDLASMLDDFASELSDKELSQIITFAENCAEIDEDGDW